MGDGLIKRELQEEKQDKKDRRRKASRRADEKRSSTKWNEKNYDSMLQQWGDSVPKTHHISSFYIYK